MINEIDYAYSRLIGQFSEKEEQCRWDHSCHFCCFQMKYHFLCTGCLRKKLKEFFRPNFWRVWKLRRKKVWIRHFDSWCVLQNLFFFNLTGINLAPIKIPTFQRKPFWKLFANKGDRVFLLMRKKKKIKTRCHVKSVNYSSGKKIKFRKGD